MRVSVPRRRKDIGNERGDGAKVGRKLGRGPGRPPFKLPKIPPPANVKDGCCRFGPTVERRFILDEKLQIAPKEEKSWSRG